MPEDQAISPGAPRLPPAIVLKGIRKSFGAVQALSGVHFELAQGEIHALLGENGAGKTTLMHILFGMLRMDAGEIEVFGSPARIHSPAEAMALGIGMVHQHFMLAPTLTVAENLFLGMRIPGLRGPWFRERQAFAAATAAAERFHIRIDPAERIEALSVGEQQRVELLKALIRGARALILDEPTAVLAPAEIDDLFETMRSLRAAGCSIVFITHKLNEVARVCDRVTVLRAGKTIGVRQARGASPRQLGEWMVGHALSEGPAEARREATGEPILALRQVSSAGRRGPRELSLEARAGEIHAIAGVEGNGQAELAEILSGAERPRSGQVWLDGADATDLGPAERARRGLAFVAGDREREGLIGAFSLADNLILKSFAHPPFSKWGWLRPKARDRFARERVERHDIRAASIGAAVSTLSGGNQQKVVLARELRAEMKALAAINPTRGLDVGAAESVHAYLRQARDQGAAILLITSDLDEALALADRLSVIVQGRLAAAPGPPFDKAAVGGMMLGEEKAANESGSVQ